MTNTRGHIINEIFLNISKDSISKNDMGQLLRDIRCLLELDKQSENFKTLYFYCNWASHPNIDRNKELYPFLEKINIGFTELPIKNSESNKKYNDYIDVIIDALDFDNLRENIYRLLFNYLGFNGIKFKPIILLICENLVQKKIHYPENLEKQDNKKHETILKTTKISEQIEKVEKFKDPSLDSELDYSKPVIIKSFIIIEIKNNEVFVELETYSEKGMKIRSSIILN